MRNTLSLYLVFQLLVLTSCASAKNAQISEVKQHSIRNYYDSKKDSKQQVYLSNSAVKTEKYCYPICPNIDKKLNIEVDHDDFLLSYNKKTKYADWVAYRINKNYLSGATKKRQWKPDPKIPLEIAMIPSDYKNASSVCNYDRGHQAPLADFSNSKNWQRVNYLSNITPQKAQLNQGAWNKLESKIRSLGKELEGELYVITGTYYSAEPMCKLPNARISNIVPNGYWKIITLVNDNNIYRATFKFSQHTDKNADYCNHQTTINEIKSITNINFYINDNIDNSLSLLDMLGCTSGVSNEYSYSSYSY